MKVIVNGSGLRGTRLNDLETKWLNGKRLCDAVVDHIVLEHFLKNLPDEE